MVVPVHRSSNPLVRPPVPSQKQRDIKTSDDTKIKISKPLSAYQIPIENKDLPLLSLEIYDIYHTLPAPTPLSKRSWKEQAGAEKTGFRQNSLSLKDQEALENKVESTGDFKGIIRMVEDIHLPQYFKALNDLDQSKTSQGDHSQR